MYITVSFLVVDVHNHKLFVFRVVAIMFASFFFPCSIPTGICSDALYSKARYWIDLLGVHGVFELRVKVSPKFTLLA